MSSSSLSVVDFVGDDAPSIKSDAEIPLLPLAEMVIYSVDEALSHIGHGLMQHLLLLILGAAYAVAAANTVFILYLTPNVKCEWAIDKTQETLVMLMFFVGTFFGANIWGTLSDRYGRRFGTAFSLFVQGAGGVMTSLVADYVWLLVAVGIVGLGIGGGSVIPFSMFSEFLPSEKRGTQLSIYQLAWSLGAVLEIGLAWLIVPSHGWRALALATTLPQLFLLFLVVFFLPESPRYLMVMGWPEQSERVLKKIAHINRKSLPYGTLVTSHSTEDVHDVSFSTEFMSLFAHAFRRVTPVLWFLAFTGGLGYYATVMLTSHLQEENKTSLCDEHNIRTGSNDYASILFVSFGEVPGVLLSLITTDRLGRVKSLVLGWCGCSCAIFLLLLFPSKTTILLFMARLFMIYTQVFVCAFTPEVYPSSCRCLAFGLVASLGRLGGAVSPFVALTLLDAYGLEIVSVLCAGLFSVAALVSVSLIPFETANRALADDIQEIQDDIQADVFDTVDLNEVDFETDRLITCPLIV